MIARPKRKNGFAVLIILVAVAIVMMLYMVNMTAIFGPGISNANRERPLWEDEERIVGPDVFIKLPRAPQPLLDDPVAVSGPVTRKDSYRGDIAVEFNTAGEVAGNWNGSYQHDNKKYTFEAEFAGNIDVSKMYSANKQTDKSKLYFITKGQYTQTVFNEKTEDFSATEGIIYVAGWLGPDHSVHGKIAITSEERDFSAEYLWQSEE